jgi:hypothetical protein
MSSLTFAYLLMLGAFACFSLMDTSAKWLVGAAIPALQVAWLRYLGHFICNSVIYLPKYCSFKLARPASVAGLLSADGNRA